MGLFCYEKKVLGRISKIVLKSPFFGSFLPLGISHQVNGTVRVSKWLTPSQVKTILGIFFFKLRPRLSTLKKIMNGAGPPHVSSLFHLENQQFFSSS